MQIFNLSILIVKVLSILKMVNLIYTILILVELKILEKFKKKISIILINKIIIMKTLTLLLHLFRINFLPAKFKINLTIIYNNKITIIKLPPNKLSVTLLWATMKSKKLIKKIKLLPKAMLTLLILLIEKTLLIKITILKISKIILKIRINYYYKFN
jgi:hypothetical protein